MERPRPYKRLKDEFAKRRGATELVFSGTRIKLTTTPSDITKSKIDQTLKGTSTSTVNTDTAHWENRASRRRNRVQRGALVLAEGAAAFEVIKQGSILVDLAAGALLAGPPLAKKLTERARVFTSRKLAIDKRLGKLSTAEEHLGHIDELKKLPDDLVEEADIRRKTNA